MKEGVIIIMQVSIHGGRRKKVEFEKDELTVDGAIHTVICRDLEGSSLVGEISIVDDGRIGIKREDGVEIAFSHVNDDWNYLCVVRIKSLSSIPEILTATGEWVNEYEVKRKGIPFIKIPVFVPDEVPQPA